MNRFWLGLLLAGLTASPVVAQGMGGEEPEGDIDWVAKYVESNDTNKDGKVSYDELKTLWAEKAKALAAAGEDEEKQAAVYEKYQYMMDVGTFVLADGDDDRNVTKEELKAYFALAEKGEQPKPSAKDLEVIVDVTWESEILKYDKNKDGVVAKDELTAEEASDFDDYDTNKDGKFTKDEFTSAMKKQMGLEENGTEPKETPKETPKDTPKETPADKGEVNREAFALYLKEGRSWTIKNITKIEGMDPMVSYTLTTVVKVGDDYAEIETSMLDKDKKPMMGMPATKTKLEFRVPKSTGAQPKDVPKVETKTETIKVEAGEFECLMVEVSGTKSWSSKKFAGLLVKMESATTTCELVEFKE